VYQARHRRRSVAQNPLLNYPLDKINRATLPSQVIRFSGQKLRSLIPDCCRISLRGNRRRIVEALEALTGDRVAEQVERLAHHALRGEVWDQALAYCQQAGEKAMARSAHREVVGSFEQALSALTHLPETRATREQAIDLRLALRSALFPSGDSERIVTYLHEAETLAAALHDPRRLGQIAGFLSAHFRNRGAYDQAIAAAQRALTLATADQDVVLQALVNQNLGAAY
jgi:tetratricopeptide (TPR) repeat protein